MSVNTLTSTVLIFTSEHNQAIKIHFDIANLVFTNLFHKFTNFN